MADITWIGEYAKEVQSFLGVNMGFPPTNTQNLENKTSQQTDNPKDTPNGKRTVDEPEQQPGFFQQAINILTVGVGSYLDPDLKKQDGAVIDAEQQKGNYAFIWVAVGAAIVAGLFLKN